MNGPRDDVRARNVEILTNAFEAFVRGDLEEAARPNDDGIVVYDHDIPEAADEGFRGREGWFRWLEEFGTSWDEFWIEPEGITAIDDDTVLVLLRLHARGKASGIELEREDGIVYRLRDEKVVRIDYFNDRAEARRAAGLEQ